MNHAVSQVVAQLLVDLTLLKWRTDPSAVPEEFVVGYGGDLPDDGDYAVAVTDTEGHDENLRNMNTGEPSLRPGITIQVRAPADAEVAPKIWSIAKALDGVSCRRVRCGETNYRVQNFSRKYDPSFLLEEERENRRVWVFRGLVTIQMES